MTNKQLLEVVRHEFDHDCECTDPEGACQACFEAYNELLKRGIDSGHYHD